MVLKFSINLIESSDLNGHSNYEYSNIIIYFL